MIRNAVNKLKINKSPEEDCIKAELLKYADGDLCEVIAERMNEVTRSGQFPGTVTNGIFTPLQKPGKVEGPTENLRHIILFSLLRKILAICLSDKKGNKINSRISIM